MAKPPFEKALLIDDDMIANHINKFMIQQSKFASTIKAVKSPLDALKLLNPKEENSESFDIIFLDLNMPIMSGWEFLDEFEKLNIPGSQPKIIMLTSSVNPKDHQQAGQTRSIYNIFSKPLSPEVLAGISESSDML